MSVILQELSGLENSLVILPSSCNDCCVDDTKYSEHEFVVFAQCIRIVELKTDVWVYGEDLRIADSGEETGVEDVSSAKAGLSDAEEESETGIVVVQ